MMRKRETTNAPRYLLRKQRVRDTQRQENKPNLQYAYKSILYLKLVQCNLGINEYLASLQKLSENYESKLGSFGKRVIITEKSAYTIVGCKKIYNITT